MSSMLLEELFSTQNTLWNVSTWSQATSLMTTTMMEQPPLSPPILPLDPLLSPSEQTWIRSLFMGDDDENENSNNDKKNRVLWMVTYCEEEEDRRLLDEPEDDHERARVASWEYFVKVATSLNPHPQVQFIHLQPQEQAQSQASERTTTCRTAMEGRPPTLVLHQSSSSSSFVWIHPYYRYPTQPPQGTEPQATSNTEDDDRIIGGSFQDPLILSSSHDSTLLPLHEVLARLLRPTLLWWDRQSTTPIAFAEYYTTHAILVVEFLHPLATTAVQDFQKACRNYQWKSPQLNQDSSSSPASSSSSLLKITQPDLVCLVVPSTETRVLKTFGIDIWSHLGVEEKEEEDNSSPLPLVFLTHRTERQGVQRYYQEDPSTSSSTHLSEFFEDFFQGRLHPELSSRWHGDGAAESSSSSDTHNHNNTAAAMILPPLTPNKHGIFQWTAFHAEYYGGHYDTEDSSSRGPRLDYTIVGEESGGNGDDVGPAYTLLLAYTPTCGHCKRIHVLWNKLGRLIQFELKWGDWLLQIARIDVSRETFQEQGAVSLPSIYLYSHHHPHHSQQEQSQHDKSRQRVQAMLPADQKDASPMVGNLKDPIDILVWFLDMTQEDDEVDEAKLLQDLKQSLSIK